MPARSDSDIGCTVTWEDIMPGKADPSQDSYANLSDAGTSHRLRLPAPEPTDDANRHSKRWLANRALWQRGSEVLMSGPSEPRSHGSLEACKAAAESEQLAGDARPWFDARKDQASGPLPRG